MAKQSKTTKVNVPMCIATILFCLTLFSIHLTSGLYAKYTTSTLSEDSARVITFGELTLSESGSFDSEGKLMIIPGVDLQKKAVVTFSGSEASTYVFAEVILSSVSPAWSVTDNMTFSMHSGDKLLMQWKIADGWTFLKADSQGTYIYYRELAPNQSLETDLIDADGKISVSPRITKNEISNMSGISIKLRAGAVQSNGFESPAAAWDSIAAKE